MGLNIQSIINYIFILCFLILGLHSDVQHTEFRFSSVQEQMDELLQMIVDTAERSKSKIWLVIQNHLSSCEHAILV